jgi:hypothetical protein
MSWLPRLQIALFAIVIVGMLLLMFRHLGSGWSALTYFVWGMVISVGVLLLNHCLGSDSNLSAETEKSFNLDRCRLSRDARRSCGFVENGLTNR